MQLFKAVILAVGRVIQQVSPKLSQKLQPLYPFSGQKVGQLARLKTIRPRVALISSAGLYLQNQKPFDYKNFYGDASFRVFPADFPLSDFLLTESDFNPSGFETDPASLFPLPELRAILPEFGGEPAVHHFSLLGFCLKEEELLIRTVPEIIKTMREDRTDLALLVPACVVCHEVLPKVAQKLEAAGVATVTFAFIPKALEKAKGPRTVLFNGDCGLPFRNSASKLRQELLRLALKAAIEMQTPGEVWRLPHSGESWPSDKVNGAAAPVR